MHPDITSPQLLRKLFVELCSRRGAAEAGPLLGDVILLTEMTADLRRQHSTEAEVRSALVEQLGKGLRHSMYSWRLWVMGGSAAVEKFVDECVAHAYWFPLE